MHVNLIPRQESHSSHYYISFPSVYYYKTIYTWLIFWFEFLQPKMFKNFSLFHCMSLILPLDLQSLQCLLSSSLQEKFVNPWSIDFCYQFCFIHNNTHTTTTISRHDLLLISFALSLFKFRCAPGYTGSPSSPGGSCQECECDPHGSLPVPCDPVTGICTCRPGATGRKCDGCEQGHAREGMECVCTYTNLIIGFGGLGSISVSFPVRKTDFFFSLFFNS